MSAKLTMTAMVWISFAAIPAAGQTVVTLEAGTPVRLTLARAISSASDRTGDFVRLTVAEAVRAGGVEILAPGTAVLASVADAKRFGPGRKGGSLQLKFNEIALRSGSRIALEDTPATQRPAGVALTGGVIATPVPAGPTAGAQFFAAGADAAVPVGARLTAYVARSAVIDAAKLTRIAPRSTTPLANEDVIEFKRAGKSEEQILGAIHNAPGRYRLDDEAIASLRSSGVSAVVVGAMLTAQPAQ